MNQTFNCVKHKDFTGQFLLMLSITLCIYGFHFHNTIGNDFSAAMDGHLSLVSVILIFIFIRSFCY